MKRAATVGEIQRSFPFGFAQGQDEGLVCGGDVLSGLALKGEPVLWFEYRENGFVIGWFACVWETVLL